jgi:hypothetical protein
MARGIVPPHVVVEVLVPQPLAACHDLRPSRSRGGGARAKRRLVVGNPSCGELVGDAANWSEA